MDRSRFVVWRLAIAVSALVVAGAGCHMTSPVPPPPAPPSSSSTPKTKKDGSTAATLGVPPGHLPKPGECRIWVPGVAPGQQGHGGSRSCAGIMRVAPARSWVIYRPTKDKSMVHVRVAGAPRVVEGTVTMIVVQVYDANNGRFLREERQHPRESFDEEERPDQAPPQQPGGGRERRT